jgi:hypothetical protein
MSKISYYSKRSGGQSYPNYSYSNHPGYIHTHKKNYNYFKPRTKYNIPPSNTYFEERNKNYIYHNNFGDNNFHNNFFQKKNYSNRYTSYPYSSEENKVEEEVISEPEKEEPKEEIMRINLNVGENGSKELVIYKDEDVRNKVLEFCNENHINKRLIEPLYKKINRSLDILQHFNNNFSLNKDELMVLNKVKNNIVGNNNENNS